MICCMNKSKVGKGVLVTGRRVLRSVAHSLYKELYSNNGLNKGLFKSEDERILFCVEHRFVTCSYYSMSVCIKVLQRLIDSNPSLFNRLIVNLSLVERSCLVCLIYSSNLSSL